MNIYDVARMAGVSTATVSRVINHSGKVSEESRRKVESVIAREGYIPNAFAHSLNTKKSKTIGIICPVISDVNHAYPVSELSRLLRREGFEVLLINTESNMESKRAFFVSLINRQVDAAIVIGCNTTQQEKRISNMQPHIYRFSSSTGGSTGTTSTAACAMKCPSQGRPSGCCASQVTKGFCICTILRHTAA